MYEYKTRLKKFCHQKLWSKPTYESIKYGVDSIHKNRSFKACVLVNGKTFNSRDFCKSSKEAQNEAARTAFNYFTTLVFSNAHSSTAAGHVSTTGNKTVVSKPRPLGERAGEAALRFALSIDRPYFIAQVKYYASDKPTYLNVPSSFAKYRLPKSKPMILRNVSGSKVENVKYTYDYQGRSYINYGWDRFASNNHLKEKDSCVFELIEENTLQMYIFRC